MLTHVHHINLLVRNLDKAMSQYRALGVTEFVGGELQGRGVKTVRFRVGETWVVLIEPTDPEGVPGQYLAQHGEGLFLLSFGVDDVNAARDTVQTNGSQVLNTSPRTGLDGWQVIDLDPGAFSGADLQLTEDPSRSPAGD